MLETSFCIDLKSSIHLFCTVKECGLVWYLKKRKTGGKVKEGKVNINEMNLTLYVLPPPG